MLKDKTKVVFSNTTSFFDQVACDVCVSVAEKQPQYTKGGSPSLYGGPGSLSFVLFLLLYLSFMPVQSTAKCSVCAAGSGEKIENIFGLTRDGGYAQLGIWHQIPCPTFRRGEKLDGVVWYKGYVVGDPSTVRLISHSGSGNYPISDRYAFSADFSLLIKGIEGSDEGHFLCQVIPKETGFRAQGINLQVLDMSFPASPNDTSGSTTLHRGRRQTLPCQCMSQSPDAPSVVYWSMGEGITTDTEIIGARFSDGVTLQIQHGADYSIDSDASLTVNSLNVVHDNQRFWCHVFQSDGTLRNCYIDSQFKDQQQPKVGLLKASELSFYLQEGREQVLPCHGWSTGDTFCEAKWLKLDPADQQVVVSYNLSTGAVDSYFGFNLATDFGLVIRSAHDEHAGLYQCGVGNDTIEVQVIGNLFPLDGGRTISRESVTAELGEDFKHRCPAVLHISEGTNATLFWSFGLRTTQKATVIGTLTLPGRSKTMSDGAESVGSFSISPEGFLQVGNYSIYGDMRYWCHIFTEEGLLLRSYVDVKSYLAESEQLLTSNSIWASTIVPTPVSCPCEPFITEAAFAIIVVCIIVCFLLLLAAVVVRERRQHHGYTPAPSGTTPPINLAPVTS
ncbi:uncharacterized protein LOC110975457 [Acanthaster planci]|uniref:Uncharacterized protein LOC110975457 n=1 Tax=Acanthaster planci TaxID=133434 RepID=A0A8B7XUH4_ACAPL|nr:uncharacterized protein LOC110975457 [Acanthaster planci]